MAQPDDIETRMTALETRVDGLSKEVRRGREDAAAARILAGAADRDVADLRGEIRDLRNSNNTSFNAMREDMTDLRHEMRDGFTQLRGVLDGQAAGIQHITNLLDTVIDKQGDQ